MAKADKPDKYATHVQPYLEQIPDWYKVGTMQQICRKLGVSKSTLYKYAEQHPELAEALKDGKASLIVELKSALKQRALGYTYEETTTKQTITGKGVETVTTTVEKHLPPDLGSIHLLLKNLDPTWHNDDKATLEIKRKELELKEKKTEAETW